MENIPTECERTPRGNAICQFHGSHVAFNKFWRIEALKGESLNGRLEKGAAELQDAQTREAQAVRHFFSPLGYWLGLVSMWGVWNYP